MANQFLGILSQEQAARLSAQDIELLQEIEAKANGEQPRNSFVEKRLEQLKREAEEDNNYSKELADSFC